MSRFCGLSSAPFPVAMRHPRRNEVSRNLRRERLLAGKGSKLVWEHARLHVLMQDVEAEGSRSTGAAALACRFLICVVMRLATPPKGARWASGCTVKILLCWVLEASWAILMRGLAKPRLWLAFIVADDRKATETASAPGRRNGDQRVRVPSRSPHELYCVTQQQFQKLDSIMFHHVSASR